MFRDKQYPLFPFKDLFPCYPKVSLEIQVFGEVTYLDIFRDVMSIYIKSHTLQSGRFLANTIHECTLDAPPSTYQRVIWD